MQKRRPVPAFAVPNEAPMSELNTTPLIDVMLVLLIMFIITIPISTHKVPLDLPQGGDPAEPLVHRLNLDSSGTAYLDGVPIGEAQLPARLEAIAARPETELHLRAEAQTPYENFDRVLAAVKRAGVVRLGLVDNERFAKAAG